MSNFERNLADEDDSDTDGEPETPFSVDVDTEGLVMYLNAYYGKRVIDYVKKNKINGKSFLSLTRDDLKTTKLPADIQNTLLQRVALLKKDTGNPKPDNDSMFVRKLILHLCIFIIILGRRFI